MMLSDSQRMMLQTKGVVIGRILLGLMFFVSGIGMLMNPGGTASFFEAMGIPMATLMVWAVIVVKIVAGGAVIIGKRVGLAAAALIIFTLIATAIAHRSFDDPSLMKNLAVIGGLLYVMAYGAGRWKAPAPVQSM